MSHSPSQSSNAGSLSDHERAGSASEQQRAAVDAVAQKALAADALGGAVPVTTPKVLIGWMTAPDRDTALSLAKAAVEAGLAACAQVSEPVLSFYRWDGALCEEAEYRITFKLSADAEPQLRALLVERHPYEVPQWLAADASHVLPEYAAWVKESCKL